MSDMTHFHILFRMTEKMTCFELRVPPLLRQNQDIWNFHGPLTSNNGKLICIAEALGMPLCQI